MNARVPIVVLISGNGSNLQALIDAEQNDAAFHICAVFSNNPDAFGLQRAQHAKIPHHCIDHRDFSSRAKFDAELQMQIDRYQPKLVVLAGFMRKLTPEFVEHYQGRLINIHPSLLPKYPGLETHRRVLEAGDAEHGVSIHYVTADVDAGPLIDQARLEVQADDTEVTLQQRVHALEHKLYPKVVERLARELVD